MNVIIQDINLPGMKAHKNSPWNGVEFDNRAKPFAIEYRRDAIYTF